MIRHYGLRTVAGLSLAALWATAAIADDPPDFICTNETAESQVAAIDTVMARIVFVGFPNEGPARQLLPSWASTLRAELETFYNEMSYGQHVLEIEVMTPVNQPNMAWIADSPACDMSGSEQVIRTAWLA